MVLVLPLASRQWAVLVLPLLASRQSAGLGLGLLGGPLVAAACPAGRLAAGQGWGLLAPWATGVLGRGVPAMVAQEMVEVLGRVAGLMAHRLGVAALVVMVVLEMVVVVV
jgi:hypothetical protein